MNLFILSALVGGITKEHDMDESVRKILVKINKTPDYYSAVEDYPKISRVTHIFSSSNVHALHWGGSVPVMKFSLTRLHRIIIHKTGYFFA